MLSSVCISSDHDFVKNDFYLMKHHIRIPPGGGIYFIYAHTQNI